MQSIFDFFERQSYSDEVDIDYEPVPHQDLIRLGQILRLKIEQRPAENGKVMYRSIMDKTLGETGTRDILLKIARHYSGFSLLDEFQDQKDFYKVLQKEFKFPQTLSRL